MFRQGEEQRLVRRICFELQMSNTMLKPAYRPKSPTDLYRTYGEYLPPATEADAEEEAKARARDAEFFEKRGIKIVGYGTDGNVMGQTGA